MKPMNKKGVLDNLGALAVGIAAFAITIVIAFLIMSQAKTNMSDNSQACANSTMFYNATDNTCCLAHTTTQRCGGANATTRYSSAFNGTTLMQEAAEDIPAWVPLIVITVIGGVLLSLVALFRKR